MGEGQDEGDVHFAPHPVSSAGQALSQLPQGERKFNLIFIKYFRKGKVEYNGR
jgi:hypothetical protein